MSYIDEHVVYVDTETTGLDPDRHEVWDIALIDGATGIEHEFHIAPVRPEVADPNALRITNFYQRTSHADWKWTGPQQGHPIITLTQLQGENPSDRTRRIRYEIASQIALVTAGKHLVGAVPSFDAAFLSRFLIANGQREAWHYHLIDIEALAAGFLGIRPPWDSDELNNLLGLPEATAKHTAIADARWAKAVYERVLYESRNT